MGVILALCGTVQPDWAELHGLLAEFDHVWPKARRDPTARVVDDILCRWIEGKANDHMTVLRLRRLADSWREEFVA